MYQRIRCVWWKFSTGSIRIIHIHSIVFPRFELNKAIAGSHIQSGETAEGIEERRCDTAGWGGAATVPLATPTPRTSLVVAIQKTPPVSHGELENTSPTNSYSKAQVTQPRPFLLAPCSVGCLNGDERWRNQKSLECCDWQPDSDR